MAKPWRMTRLRPLAALLSLAFACGEAERDTGNLPVETPSETERPPWWGDRSPPPTASPSPTGTAVPTSWPPPTGSPAPTGEPRPPGALADDPIDASNPDYALLSEVIFAETNAQRVAQGLPALQPCEPCTRAAQQHGDDMVALNFFSHTHPDPALASPGQRLVAAGLTGYSGWAENIADYPIGQRTYRQFAQAVVDGWMNSSGHRANILSPQMTHLGAACGVSDAGRAARGKCVQVFARLTQR